MSVTQIFLVVAGLVIMTTNMLIGLRLRGWSETDVEAAAANGNGKAIDLKGAHLVGLVMMVSGPVMFLLLTTLAFTTIAS